MENNTYEEFYHDGYVCVCEQNESVGNLIENHQREKSNHLLSLAEEEELLQPLNVNDLEAATIQINRKLSLFERKVGNFVPSYKFSHQVLDEESSVPSLKDLDRGLFAAVHNPSEDHRTPLYYLPFLRKNYEILKDFRRLITNINGGLRTAFNVSKRALRNDCGKRLEMLLPSLSRQTQNNMLQRYNKLRKYQDLLELFINLQKRRILRTHVNMLTCSLVFRDRSNRLSIPVELGRYMFLLYNYHVATFDLFAMSCKKNCQKILNFSLEVNSFLLLLDTYNSK